MKAAQRSRLTRAIALSVDGLSCHGRLLVLRPLGRILRGLYLEDSIDANRVYIWAFAQPLYVPASTVVFDLGERVGGGTRTWGAADADGVRQELGVDRIQAILSANSPERLADWISARNLVGPQPHQARAYSLVAAGRLLEGINSLQRLDEVLGDDPPWSAEMKARARQLIRMLQHNPAEALQQLQRWETETTRNLRLQGKH